MKTKIKKNIRKYITTFLCVLVIPCFTAFNAYAFTFPLNAVSFAPSQKDNAYINLYDSRGIVVNSFPLNYDFGEYSTEFHITSDSLDCRRFAYGFVDSFTYNFNFDAYDYYVGLNIFFSGNSSIDIDSGVRMTIENLQESWQYYPLTDFRVSYHRFPTGTTYPSLYSFFGKMQSGNYSSIRTLTLYFDSADFVTSNYNELTCFIYEVPKNTAAEEVYNLLEYGNSNTEYIVDDFNYIFDEFNYGLGELESFDWEIIDGFSYYNEEYLNELDNFELSDSLLNAATWLSTSMQSVYDGSADYKMLWLVPLLFGIPILLFVIRKSGGDDD